MIHKACLCLISMFAVASIAYGVAQNPVPIPQEPGQVILNRACTVCHTLGEVTKFKGYYSRDQWADVVRTMRADGASLQDSDVTPLVDYLFKTYGKVETPAVDWKKLLESSCTGCHDLSTVSAAKYNKDDWQGVIERMMARGAEVDEAQIPSLADYLSKTFGPQ